MAAYLSKAIDISRVIWHSMRLTFSGPNSCSASMIALRDLGNVSLPLLRNGIRHIDDPGVAARFAVVLHWLGQSDGMPVLIDSIRYGKHLSKAATEGVVNGFLWIGAPDSTQALVQLWRHLPQLEDSNSVAVLICRIFRELNDPFAMSALCETPARTPGLFLAMASYFGADAIPTLQQLSTHYDPQFRSMAVKGLAKVPGDAAARAILPLLMDPESEVRREAPAALEAVAGPVRTLNAIVLAHNNGYTTAESVQTLKLYSPPDLDSLLEQLINRYDPSADRRCTDTSSAVCEAIVTMSIKTRSKSRLVEILCRLSERDVTDDIRISIGVAISEVGTCSPELDIVASRAMCKQLSRINRDARSSAAIALARLGDGFGQAFEAMLESVQIQGKLLQKLQSAFINSQDVSQAVTEAVQHVASWLQRFSREAAERFATPGTSAPLNASVLADKRTPELLNSLISSALDTIETVDEPSRVMEAISVAVSCLRLISKLEDEIAQEFDALMRRAFVCCRKPAWTWKEMNSASAVVREAAADALIHLHGSAMLELFVKSASEASHPVQLTSIAALGRLGDPRCVAALKTIAQYGDTMLKLAAEEALTAIKRGNPEMMTLLRGSSGADTGVEQLVRPVQSASDTTMPELLLRPAGSGANESTAP